MLCVEVKPLFNAEISHRVPFFIVMELMAPPPFEKPPRFIRVDLYTYHYTQYNQSESL